MTASTLAPAEQFNDYQRYQLAAGKLIKFHAPPSTTPYKISTTSKSIGAKGTLLELQPTSSPESSCTTPSAAEEWDTYPNQPLYAARYESPFVSRESRTVYWEVDLDNTTDTRDSSPEAAVGSDNDGELLIGFAVKDTARIEAMRTTLSQSGVDPRLHSTSTSTVSIGPSILVNTHTGLVYSNGTELASSLQTHGKNTRVGIGMTFAFKPPSSSSLSLDHEKLTEKKTTKKSVFKKFVDKHSTPTHPSASPEDLQPVPASLFITTSSTTTDTSHADDNEPEMQMIDIDISTLNTSDLGFDGTRDVYPALVVKGNSVKAVLKFGECVAWSGAGGSGDAKVKGLGNRAKDGFVEARWPFKASNTYGWLGM